VRNHQAQQNLVAVDALLDRRISHDEAANIERCLTSLLAQKYPNIEFFVLDDESTDATAAIDEVGFGGSEGEDMLVLENAPKVQLWRFRIPNIAHQLCT